ncbi:MAG TPA: CBS domain-containing protein [Acidimicrobiales bacterium]|nr:CBS domain-containing protein [Acidimicrobiales bacterium]
MSEAQIRIEWESAPGTRRSAPVTGPRSPVAALVARPALVISGDATIAEAAAAMHLAGVSCLLVGGGAGIVTERDVTRAVERGVDPECAVARIATHHPITAPADMTVVEAAAVMLNEEIRHLVVEHPEIGRGVVSLRDVTAVLLQAVDPGIWLGWLRQQIGSPTEIWLG